MEIKKISDVKGVTNGKNSALKNKKVPAEMREQNNEISNICYKPLSFGRTWAEHRSWGAVVDPKTKDVSFKIFTYPDTKRATVTVEKRNNRKNKTTYELTNKGNGIFQTEKSISGKKIENGDIYYYTLYKGNGDIDKVKDPYSFRQETIMGESTIYDHSLYKWKDDDWFKNNKKRISRIANKDNELTPLSNARIYEFNTATLSKKGTFDAAKQIIKSLPEEGFNTIEIMPVENTYSYNWGYDGVDKMAPAEHLGGPDELKSLIDYAHEQGLNVIMDIVPNHIGPDGASLKTTGPYSSGSNAFGDGFNYEGNNSLYVRDFIVNAALNWLDNYHCDGLRFDMTEHMKSDYTMKQIAAEINYHKPDAFIIAEDGRGGKGIDIYGHAYDNDDDPHDKRITNPLNPDETCDGKTEYDHCNTINKLSSAAEDSANPKNLPLLDRLGFDSVWDFNYFHQLQDCVYGVADLDTFEQACYCAQDSVKYVMSHDEIGNFEGTRLLAKLMVPMLNLNENIELNKKDEERAKRLNELNGMDIADATRLVKLQKAQFVAESLALLLQTGELDKYDTSKFPTKQGKNAVEKAFRKEILEPHNIKADVGINYETIKTMFNKSYSKNKMALARTFSIPGPKMVFQGDDKADLTPFRFFREFFNPDTDKNIPIEKGYNSGFDAFQISKMGNIKYSSEGKATINKFKTLTKCLNQINEENPALTRGYLVMGNTVKHQPSQVIATHAVDNESNNEIFSITNFSDYEYPRIDAGEYFIKFPPGQWVELLNTDDKKFGGTGLYCNPNVIDSDGENNIPIKISDLSTIMFKKID